MHFFIYFENTVFCLWGSGVDINKNRYETSTRSYGSNHGRGGETWKSVRDSWEVKPGVMQCAE